MIPVSRFTQTVTLRHRVVLGGDEYGNPATGETTEEAPCHVRKLSASEVADSVTQATWKLYLAPGTSLDSVDAATIDGLTFEIVGDPIEHYNPRSRLVEAVSAEMRRAE